MTTPSTIDHAARIEATIKDIEDNELPLGTVIRSRITLGSCPNDMERIRRGTDALAIALEEAQHRTPEERGLMTCPFCGGKGGGLTDDPSAMEPASVNACYCCDGEHYINPERFVRAIIDAPCDLASAIESAKLTPEEGMWT